ncbi:MAG TPA: RsmD family RNA methyltransferase, partial [Pyrinomonadaceae bacterium]|nr:RsmD family RNA methyltransferase [Pyrinomonadaceae bacterium]
MENRRHGRNSTPGQRPYSHDRDRRSSYRRATDESGSALRGGPPTRETGRTNNKSTREFGKPYGKPRRSTDARSGQRQQGNGRLDPKRQHGSKRLHKPARVEEPRVKITSDDQVTDGIFRGHHLKNSLSPRTSHTDRKLREALFKIVARRIKGRRFLDLGAGSGTIGIEAISRGTMLSSFVERSPRMCGFVRRNLEELGIKNGHGEVVELEIMPFLKRAAKSRRVWDLVYLGTLDIDDNTVFDYLKRGVPLGKGALLVIE